MPACIRDLHAADVVEAYAAALAPDLVTESDMQAIVDTVEKVVAAHMERRDAEQAQRSGATADLSSGLPRAYGNTASEHGLEPAEDRGPVYA